MPQGLAHALPMASTNEKLDVAFDTPARSNQLLDARRITRDYLGLPHTRAQPMQGPGDCAPRRCRRRRGARTWIVAQGSVKQGGSAGIMRVARVCRIDRGRFCFEPCILRHALLIEPHLVHERGARRGGEADPVGACTKRASRQRLECTPSDEHALALCQSDLAPAPVALEDLESGTVFDDHRDQTWVLVSRARRGRRPGVVCVPLRRPRIEECIEQANAVIGRADGRVQCHES
mmetsp:Transcript_28754/g.70695  ORF Transcript_28754/g.70695 Transcript_28754/m.70695 type:complete len:234 (-) Transcript_28754:316-1017(-)